METIDRRRMVGGILCGALAAAGFALMPGATEAQVVVVGPHHRHHWHHHHIGGATIAAGFAGGIEVGASVAGDDASAVQVNALEPKRWSVRSP